LWSHCKCSRLASRLLEIGRAWAATPYQNNFVTLGTELSASRLHPHADFFFRETDMVGKRGRPRKPASHYSPHRDTARSTDLLKILGQELREHCELPHELPHRMLTLLMQLRGKSGTAK
jgi:hypothetical protein